MYCSYLYRKRLENVFSSHTKNYRFICLLRNSFYQDNSDLSITESFEKYNYNLIVATSCLIPDIRPKRYNDLHKNCTASGVMFNLEDKEVMNQSPSPLVTFELSMKKNKEGNLSITYMVEEIDKCPDDVSKHLVHILK